MYMPLGEYATLTIELEISMQSLRSAAAAATSLKAPTLIFDGTVLLDDALVSAIGLRDGSILQVAVS